MSQHKAANDNMDPSWQTWRWPMKAATCRGVQPAQSVQPTKLASGLWPQRMPWLKRNEMAILNRWFKLWWVTFLNPTLRASWSTCRHPSPHDNHWPPFLSFLDHSHSKQIPLLPDRTPAPCLSHVRLPHELFQIFETKLKLSIPCHACCFGERTAPPSNCPCDRLHEALRCHCRGSEPPKKLEANHAGTPKEHKISQVPGAL